jgi:hypothetical protein
VRRADARRVPRPHLRLRVEAVHWVCYEVRLTETCDEERPHLITHVETANAPAGYSDACDLPGRKEERNLDACCGSGGQQGHQDT